MAATATNAPTAIL
ncbi:hypothetical protein S40288_07528, partial [Stachybotrys chartarum IBT 40288]